MVVDGERELQARQPDLQQKCKDKLADFAVWMQNNPQAQVSLDGHPGEADDRSQSLATKRVAAVRDELIRLGASPGRITVGTYGRQAPGATRPQTRAWS